MLQEQRLRHRVEIQSRQIEQVMERQNMPAQIAGGSVGRRSIRFDLQTHLALGWDRLRDLADDLKEALRAPDVALSRQGGRWQLDVAFREEPPVSLLDLLAMTPDMPPHTAALGLSADGRPVLLQFDPKDVTHMLLSGMKGAGKTTLIRTMAVSLALTNRQSNVQLLIMDPRTGEGEPAYTELEPLNFLPHMLTSVIYDQETAVEVLFFLVNELNHREQHDAVTPHLVVFIDQAAAFMDDGGAPVVDALTHLLQRGQKVGIHLILSTEQPGAEAFDATLRANLAVRVVGQVPNRQTARDAAASDGSGAETLFGRGDFLAITNGRQVNFQAAAVSDYDLHMCLAQLQRPPVPTLMAHPYSIRPHLDEIPAVDAPDNRQNVMIFDANGRLWPRTGMEE